MTNEKEEEMVDDMPLNLAVIELRAEGLQVVDAVSVDSYEEAYRVAEEWIMSIYEDLGYKCMAEDCKYTLEIQEALREDNYCQLAQVPEKGEPYDFSKSIVVQIIDIR